MEEVKETELTPEEAEAALSGDAPSAGEQMRERLVAATTDERSLPDWATLPANVVPPPERQPAFMLFKAELTARPSKGNRVVVLWPLSVAEEKLAYGRARGDNLRAVDELAKACVRSIDGLRIDWVSPSSPAYIDTFWNDIGKCRSMILNYYSQVHMLSTEEKMDFFANCFVLGNAVGG